MHYENELKYVQKLLSNLRIKLRYFTGETSYEKGFSDEVGLQDILNYSYDNNKLLDTLITHCQHNTIYKIKNEFLCNYLIFRLPDTTEPNFIYVGPYLLTPVTKQEILKIAEHYNVAPGNFRQLEQYFLDIPMLNDENILLTIMYTLGEYLWGDTDHFTTREISYPISGVEDLVVPIPDIMKPEEAKLSMQIIENRYETEKQLIQAVSNGQTHKAELYFTTLTSRQFEPRSNNPLRDLKNYTIILNTILRKAVEKAAVHPINIDSISSQYAIKIELLTSPAACISLQKEMVRKYCMLVKNHSLKGYSLLVRKVITEINFDLTADLSLKTQAEALNVNPSYLSTLFKKETGITLTEYVNRKRIEHALLLLNSTDLQIQMIAQYCGIPDVNYFTKTFKKIVGKTPKEYRDMITTQLEAR